MAKRVAVIGAGASGLVGIKCCLDEGLDPVCYERTDQIGGLWNYSEKVTEGQGSIAKSTVINTSKEIMCYSDFPIPKDFPNFMHNTKVVEYFQLYAENFDLLKHIKFKTKVLSLKRAGDYDVTGRWELKVQDNITEKITTEIFDAVLLCTGHHADKHVPRFEGDSRFKGKILHTNEYRNHLDYTGHRVVVVGIGNSGGDAAVELSRVAKKVFLSTRRGSWIMNRVADFGIPLDMLLMRRALMAVVDTVPFSISNTLSERKLNQRFNHELYGLRPKHRLNEAHATVNDELPTRILSGMVVVKPNIKRFTQTGIEFEDGTFEDNIDTVILATGYIFGFSYLEPGVIPVEKNRVSLYKYVFPPDLKHPTLAVVGCVQPWGAINPISEMNCRWATRVFKGVTKLPPKDDMYADIKLKRDEMDKRYVVSQRHTIQVDYIQIMDELANEFGAKPDIWHLLKTDPLLALRVVFGPCTPYQFRLNGPGKWRGAREAIMTQWDRVYAALNTRQAEPPPRNWKALLLLLVAVAILVKWFFY